MFFFFLFFQEQLYECLVLGAHSAQPSVALEASLP